MRGITLAEVLVVIGVLAILLLISVPSFVFFQKDSELSNDAEEIVGFLRLAQSRTLSSEDSEQYGVYFEANQYTLFKGSDYTLRDVSADRVYVLSSEVEIYDINLAGSEVVFQELTGLASQTGSISLRLISEPGKTKTIYIQGSGYTGFEAPVLPAGGKISDSRHMHFDYTRLIDTANEKIILDFGTVQEEIVINNFLSGGQFFWEGEVDVSGEMQVLKIHTHRLNGPDTQFCIHRDRRYNNKTMTVTVSGDTSGFLVQYSADGVVFVNPTYVSSYEEQ